MSVNLFDFSDAPIEAIHQAMGQLIAARIPAAWFSARALAEIEEDGNCSAQDFGSRRLRVDPGH